MPVTWGSAGTSVHTGIGLILLAHSKQNRRRPKAPRRPETSAPPSTAASPRSSKPADSLRAAQESATGTAHVRNSNGKASDNKSNARPKKQRKPPMRPQARAALLTVLPRGPVDVNAARTGPLPCAWASGTRVGTTWGHPPPACSKPFKSDSV